MTDVTPVIILFLAGIIEDFFDEVDELDMVGAMDDAVYTLADKVILYNEDRKM